MKNYANIPGAEFKSILENAVNSYLLKLEAIYLLRMPEPLWSGEHLNGYLPFLAAIEVDYKRSDELHSIQHHFDLDSVETARDLFLAYVILTRQAHASATRYDVTSNYYYTYRHFSGISNFPVSVRTLINTLASTDKDGNTVTASQKLTFNEKCRELANFFGMTPILEQNPQSAGGNCL